MDIRDNQENSQEDFNDSLQGLNSMFGAWSDLEMAATASEVGLSSYYRISTYYCNMLMGALEELSKLTGHSIPELKDELEQSLDLVGVIESNLEQLGASVEVMRDYLNTNKMEDE